MRAVICHAFGAIGDLRVENVEEPMADNGQVCVDVKACGINYYDGLAVAGQYQTRPDPPFSPGGEVAGVVRAIGDDVTDLRPGQRVLAFTGFGGYAERVVVPASRVFPISDNMDFEQAAGFLIAYATSHHALKDRATLKPGQTLLVLGAAGGVGLAAVELGKLMGAQVIAAASSGEKLALCKQYGADHAVNYAETDLRDSVRELTDGKGVDVVYDPVGGAQAEAALRCLAAHGRHLVIGFASGDIPKLAFNRLLLKQISLTGVLWGAFARSEPARNTANVAELLSWYEQGHLRPHICEVFSLDEFATAMGRVMNKEAKGKVVLRVDDQPADEPSFRKAGE